MIISNHGGRQADGVCSTCIVLPKAVEAVGGRGQVLVDGGIRSGVDVLKMMALGADGCLIGRAYMFALAAQGGKGVSHALDIIKKELDLNMALCGLCDIRKLPADLIFDRELQLERRWESAAPANISGKAGML